MRSAVRVSTRILLVVGFSVASMAQARDVNVADRAKRAFDVVMTSGWPSLPSNNIRRTVFREPEAFEKDVFDNLMKRSGLSASGFELKLTSYGEVICDSQRKLILADPEWINAMAEYSAKPELTITALFAHEVGHYVLDVYNFREGRGRELFGRKPFIVNKRVLPKKDDEHAQVEPIAAEIMRRAGYSVDDIRLAFLALHGWHQNLDDELRKGYPGGERSTDIATRRHVIQSYLTKWKKK